jgi:hypothetical protein
LQPGKYDKTIQFGTIRKFRSAFGNVYHGQQAMVMAKDTRKIMVTKYPAYGEFFEHFVRGLHKLMSEIVKPDRALSPDILKEIFLHLERELEYPTSDLIQVAMDGAFYITAYCCTLRGEEIPMADLNDME